MGGLQGAGLDAAVAGVAGGTAGRYLPPGQGLDLGIQQRLVFLHDGDVVGFLVVDQPVQVRPDRVEGVGGHHGAGQVHRFQELGEMAGLVVLDVDFKVVQEVPAVFGGAEEVDPGAVGAAGSAGRLAVHGHCPQPAAGQHCCLLGGTPGAVVAHAGRRRPAGAPTAARAGPSRARVRARGSRRSSTTRIVFSSGARYRPVTGSHGARSRARSAWLARLTHCPTAVNRSFPAAVNAQTAIATRQASG